MNGGLICLPIVASSNREALDGLALAATEPADLHELRLDLLEEPPDVAGLVAASSRPVIATCRSRREGGGFRGGPAERLAILQSAIDAGAAHVDAEEDVVCGLTRSRETVVIASWHDFSGLPADLSALVNKLAGLPCDWVKFAVTPGAPEDNLKIFDAIAACPKPAIGVAMGEMGLPSRILGPAFGSRVTFGGLAPGLESAPGQPTAKELANLYRVRELSRRTQVYGLLGNPVSQSPGFICHNRAFALAGIDAVYLPFLCRDAESFLSAVPGRLRLHGLSVTIPHKRAALAWAKTLSDSARRTGAANTLSLRNGVWRGDNTDCPAVAGALAKKAASLGMSLGDGPALVMGSGGAARGMGAALESLGCRVTLAGRNPAKTADLARAMGWKTASWPDAWRGAWLVVANATPVGMSPDADSTPFPACGWRRGMLAFDAVYRPRPTRFLREAAAAGAATVDGMEMFVRQAAGQFRLWTGRDMPAVCFHGI